MILILIILTTHTLTSCVHTYDTVVVLLRSLTSSPLNTALCPGQFNFIRIPISPISIFLCLPFFSKFSILSLINISILLPK